jgi:large subunit ribosomal protein L14
MLQIGTILNVVDNTGAKNVKVIKINPGFKRRYAFLTDTVLVSIKVLRTKRRETIKIKKGEVLKALVIRTKTSKIFFSGDFFFKSKNYSVILLTKQNKILGTRIFGSVSKKFRETKFIKILTLCSGSSSL